jgi:hypothetical protein
MEDKYDDEPIYVRLILLIIFVCIYKCITRKICTVSTSYTGRDVISSPRRGSLIDENVMMNLRSIPNFIESFVWLDFSRIYISIKIHFVTKKCQELSDYIY